MNKILCISNIKVTKLFLKIKEITLVNSADTFLEENLSLIIILIEVKNFIAII